MDLEAVREKMQRHYQQFWQQGDPWQFETSEFEGRRYGRLLERLSDRRYGRVLELGCGSGRFSHLLATLADEVLALDIAQAAIDRARAVPPLAASGEREHGRVEFRVANIMDFDCVAEGPWDLIVLTETIYSLGWLYPFFNVAWLARSLLDATVPGGRCLLSNTFGQDKDWLMRPWLIHTYRDLFRNVGYELEEEEIFRGTKHGIDMDVLISIFIKNVAPNGAITS